MGSTRHQGYANSINTRRSIEKMYGYIKHWGGLRQLKLPGIERVSAVFCLKVIPCKLIRLGKLLKPAMATA